MNRWKQAALICTIAAALSNCSPAMAGISRHNLTAQTAAIGVINHFPSDLASGVALDAPLTVEFGGDINQSFYQTVNLNLLNGTEPVEGEMFYNPSARQIMFKSQTPLKSGRAYTAQLSYYDGLGRTSQKMWTFHTSNGQNHESQLAPEISTHQTDSDQQANLVLTNASMGSGKVNAETPLEISFSEPLDIVTLRNAPVQLFENNQPVGIDYKLSRDMKTLTITARQGLNANADYAVAVERSLAATSGSRLRQKTLIPFKIGDPNAGIEIAAHIIDETTAPRTVAHNHANPFEQASAPQRPARQAAPTRQAAAPVQNRQQIAPARQVELIGLAPQNGQRVTNLSQPVTIAFSDEINDSTLNEFTFRLEDDFGPVPAKIHYFKGHKQATLTPIGVLDQNKNYRVVVTQGVTDLAGQPIKNGISSMFATASPVTAPAVPEMIAQPQQRRNPTDDVAMLEQFEDNFQQPVAQYAQPMVRQQVQPQQRRTASTALSHQQSAATAPASRQVRTSTSEQAARAMQQNQLQPFKVTSIFPGLDSNNVSRNSKIAVHFSEAADSSTIDNINISVFGNQTRVNGRVVWDAQNNRAIFQPSHPLRGDTKYRVIVSDKITSEHGEPLSSGFSWQFATADQLRRQYQPRQAEANTAFFIPLEDGRAGQNRPQKGNQAANSIAAAQKTLNGATGAFNFVPQKHWSFKAMRHISSRGILNAFPFVYTENVTRYEFASAINNALSNLRTMQHSPTAPKLKVADLVELQKLIIEFRGELRSYGVNPAWFESFLQQQGVNLQNIDMHVRKLNQTS